MNGFNKVILAGNLTRDPETRYTQNGNPITSTGLAINRKWRNEEGEKQETTFVDVTFFGRTAETAAQHLRKGNPILIEGRLQLEQWQDRQSGERRQKISVIAENLTFLPTSQGQAHEQEQDSRPAPPKQREQRPPASNQQRRKAVEPEEEDDVPF